MKKLPYLEIKGNYHDVGFVIGNAFRNTIQKNINNRKLTTPDYQKNKFIKSFIAFDHNIYVGLSNFL